jgi:tRNA(Glu) U13 pseudouridine synthase TruD
MDRSDALLDAIDDLEELAGLLLCNEWHNSAKRPQHSQVRQVYSKWERCVKEEHVRLSEREERDTRREAEGEAERLAVRVAETSRRLERIVQRVAEAERVDTERIEAERLAEIVAETSRRRMAQQIAEAERLAAEREAERLAAMDVMTDVEEEVQELVCNLDDNMFLGN